MQRVCAVGLSTALTLATSPVAFAAKRVDGTLDEQGFSAPISAQMEEKGGDETSLPKEELETEKGPSDKAQLSVGSFDLAIEGSVSDVDRESLSEAFGAGLARGDSVTSKLGAAKTAQSCNDAQCWQELGREKKVDVVIWAEVTVKSRDYVFHIIARDTRSGEQVAENETTCDICGISEAESTLKDSVSQVREKLDQLGKLAELKITAEPVGSQIFVDGKFRGLSPVTLHLPAGEHAIEVRNDGYLGTQRKVTLVGGIEEHQEFVLEPKVEVSKGKRRWAIASVSAGAASLVGGATLLALHGRPDVGNCSEAKGTKDADGDCKHLWNLRWFGFGATVVGAAAIGWGVSVLMDRPKKKSPGARAKRKSTPLADVQVGVGLRSVSVNGRF